MNASAPTTKMARAPLPVSIRSVAEIDASRLISLPLTITGPVTS